MQNDHSGEGKRARRMLVCACGCYLSYTLPGFILHLLRHFADDEQVALFRSAARMVSPCAVEVMLGLEGNPGPETILGKIVCPFIDGARDLRRPARAGAPAVQSRRNAAEWSRPSSG